MLIFRSGKPQYLVSQPSSFLTCSMEKSALRSTSQLFIVLCLSPHVSLFPSHIFHLFYSLTLMHSHLSFFVLRLTSVLFLPLTHLVFNCFSHLFFLTSFTSCLHPPPGPHTRSILLGFARPILLLFICSCVWIELSTSASGEALKKERKKRKRTKYNTQESLPLRVHHKLDSKHEGPSPCNPLFSILLGGKCVRRAGQPCNLKRRVTEHKAL